MLTDLKVHKDEKGFYLSAEYIFKENYSTKKLTIPKIRLDYRIPPFVGDSECTYIYVSQDKYLLDPDDNGCRFTLTTIEEKPQEMTLSEIEKKLGHKVKIVSE